MAVKITILYRDRRRPVPILSNTVPLTSLGFFSVQRPFSVISDPKRSFNVLTKNISTLKYYDISVKLKQANDLSVAYLSYF